MAAKRKTMQYGSTGYTKAAPLPPEIPRIINYDLDLDQALMLREGLTAAIEELNSLNRATIAGRSARVRLQVNHARARIVVARITKRT